MKILYISYDGLTDPLGQSQVIPYMIGLSKKGCDISIFSAEKRENFYEDSEEVQQLLENNNIKWHYIFYRKKPLIISTILDIYELKRKAKRLYKKQKFDIVHCRSYISAFIGVYLKKFFKVKFIFDMRGFFADERVDGGLWNIKNPVYRFIYNYFKKKEIDFLSNADYTICLTESGKSIILSWKNLYNQPIPNLPLQGGVEVIPCCVDIELFSRENINQKQIIELQQKFEINKDDFVISYVGSLSTWYLPDEMFAFFKRLLLKKNKVKFLFITNEDKNFILEKAQKFGIPEEKIIIQKAKYNEVPQLLALSKISVFFIKPVFSKKASSPTKMAEIMSMGIPLICNANVGDVETIMNQSNAGIIIKKFSLEDYDNAILQIDRIIRIPPAKIRESAIKFFSLKKGIELYYSVYQRIAGI